MSLGQYVLRRTGIPLGASGSLRMMFSKSFSAKSPKVFWQYWNPVFSYYLGKYIHSPIKRILPVSVATILTFLVSGFIHDLATILVRGSTRFLFTTWFFFLGLGVIIGEIANVKWPQQRKSVPVLSNILYLILNLGLAYGVIFILSTA